MVSLPNSDRLLKSQVEVAWTSPAEAAFHWEPLTQNHPSPSVSSAWALRPLAWRPVRKEQPKNVLALGKFLPQSYLSKVFAQTFTPHWLTHPANTRVPTVRQELGPGLAGGAGGTS